jgi:hypothetical protein
VSTVILTPSLQTAPRFRFLPMAALNLRTESHLVRLHGRVGWLTYDAAHREVTLREPFGSLVVRPEELAQVRDAEGEEVAEYVEQCRFVRDELSAYYDRNTYTGD